jgi:hypothetical protein
MQREQSAMTCMLSFLECILPSSRLLGANGRVLRQSLVQPCCQVLMAAKPAVMQGYVLLRSQQLYTGAH